MSIYKLSKLARSIIYLSLFLPLAIIPSTIWEYVFVRSLIFYCFTAILLFLSIIYLHKNKQNTAFFSTPLFWAVLAFIVVRVISGFLGVDPAKSFFGSATRMDGNLGYIALFGWFFAILVFFNNKELWLKLLKASVIAAGVASVFAVLQVFFPANNSFISGKTAEQSFFAFRLFGSLGNPIFLAGYILPHIFISLFIALKENNKKRKICWFILSVFFVFIVFLTQTRGAMVSFFVTTVLLTATAVIYFLKNNKKILLKSFIFGLPFLALIAIIGKFVLWTRFQGIFSLAGTAATRLLLWKIGILGFFDKWLFGYGPENYSYAFSKFYNPELLKYSFYETWADKPHNQFVEMLSTIGILGFVVFGVIIFLFLRAVLRLAIKEKGGFLPYILIGGVAISYLGHIFFAFDTPELKMALFLIFGFIVFSEADSFYTDKKNNNVLFRVISIVLLLALFSSLVLVGKSAFSAAHYANMAGDALMNNKYSDASLYFNKLKGVPTPYANDNWEYLSDVVLKEDAIANIPKMTLTEVLPVVIFGLEKAANGIAAPSEGLAMTDKSADLSVNFSYHFRLGQMYNLAGTYLDEKYLDKSVEELLKARNISPKRQVTDLTLAQVYYAKRDIATAIKTLEDLAKANEDISPEPYWYLGILYDANGQYKESYAYMSAAVDKGYGLKNIGEAIFYVTVLGRQKDYKHMAPAYERIIGYDGANPKWWASLATVYLELKRFDDARRAARQAIFLDPKYGDEGENFLKKVDATEQGK